MTFGFAVAQIERRGQGIEGQVVAVLEFGNQLGIIDRQRGAIGNGAEQVKVFLNKELSAAFVDRLDRAAASLPTAPRLRGRSAGPARTSRTR